MSCHDGTEQRPSELKAQEGMESTRAEGPLDTQQYLRKGFGYPQNKELRVHLKPKEKGSSS